MSNVGYFCKKYGRSLIILFLIILCLFFIVHRCYQDVAESKKEEKEEVVIASTLEVKDKADDSYEKEEIPESQESVGKELEDATSIYVDVKGAVVNPGVYQVKENSIVNEVITMAGGFNADAYSDGINLSKKVSDELVIFVYTTKEIEEDIPKPNTDKTCEASSYDITDCVKDKNSIIESETNKKPDSSPTNEKEEAKLVNINTASIEELTTITGIGTSKATAIVNYRNENGPFKAINDLINVKGIGETLFAKIKSYITI